MKIVYVVGPPCAGKSEYVEQHRGSHDVVIDADALAHALGYPHDRLRWPADDHPAREVMFRTRFAAIRAAREHTGSDATCWVISTRPPAARDQERVTIDPGRDVCHDRADASGRPSSTHAEIDAWYGVRTGSRAW